MVSQNIMPEIHVRDTIMNREIPTKFGNCIITIVEILGGSTIEKPAIQFETEKKQLHEEQHSCVI